MDALRITGGGSWCSLGLPGEPSGSLVLPGASWAKGPLGVPCGSLGTPGSSCASRAISVSMGLSGAICLLTGGVSCSLRTPQQT
eukprot:2740174-Alexandrium_andersonii.AAC.1